MKRKLGKAFLVLGTPTLRDLQRARNSVMMVVAYMEKPNGKADQAESLMDKMTSYVDHVNNHPYYKTWLNDHQSIHFLGIRSDYDHALSELKRSVDTLNGKNTKPKLKGNL